MTDPARFSRKTKRTKSSLFVFKVCIYSYFVYLSIINCLDSNESGSQQASTNQNTTKWAQLTDEALSSNTLEFLDKVLLLDYPETQIYSNNQNLYQDSQKVTKNVVQVFNKYSQITLSCSQNVMKTASVFLIVTNCILLALHSTKSEND